MAGKQLTVADLRKFLLRHRGAPGRTPVYLRLPTVYFGPEHGPDHEGLPAGYDSVAVSAVAFEALSDNDDGSIGTAEGYVPPRRRTSDEHWDFSVVLDVDPEEFREVS
jgi:hypothetical protein